MCRLVPPWYISLILLCPPAMSQTESLFVTRLYRAELAGRRSAAINRELSAACRSIARQDVAGQTWSRQHGYRGYTSYASLDDLAWRSPEFQDLQERLGVHVAAFAREADFDL